MTRTRLIRLVLAAAVLAVAAWLLRGYTTDDTWIHLRFASNLIERGEFAFNPGHDTYGASSPLWIFVLAGLLQLGLAPAAAAWTAGALSGLLVLLLADAVISRMTFRPAWRGLVLLAIVADAWFLRWTFSGMETPLATAALLVLLWPLVSARDVGWGVTREPMWQRYLAWGAAAGLAGLVRPEFLLMAPAALPWLLWFEYHRANAIGGRSARWRARPQGPLLAAAVGWLAVAGPWLVFARLTFGHLTPGTATAKSGGLSLDPQVVLPGLLQAVRQLGATQAALWLTLAALIGYVLVRNYRFERAGSADGWWPGDDEDEDDDAPEPPAPGAGPWSVWGPVALVGIAVTWTGILAGGYAVKQVWIISRYLSPLVPVQVLALAVTAEWLVLGLNRGGSARRVRRGVLYGGIAAHLALNAWLLGAWVVPHARAFPEGLRTCYLGMGGWLRENTPPGTVVAALDIGAVGWASERRVLDLMGLVSPEIRDLGRTLGFAEMIESGAWLGAPGPDRPRWLVDRAAEGARFDGRVIGGVRFELVETCVIRGVGLREPQPWTVALYRLISTEN
ncbi:MAG: hypothetical protein IH621_09620 [Krumholzibacteria bacterium]|nr:hypothetical protein [Candidatus Krumholzibacteria bacterium]